MTEAELINDPQTLAYLRMPVGDPADHETYVTGVVLRHMPGLSECQPYVTHRVYPVFMEDEMISTEMGHYFVNKADAAEDFRDRCSCLITLYLRDLK